MCPGQGSQSEGFLNPWIAEISGFKDQLELLSEYCKRDLVHLGTLASEEEIKDTANAQPLIVGASLAAARSALSVKDFDAVVGHSVGEFAAAAIAGVLTDAQAMELVAVRANAMARAAKLTQTSMAAILGAEVEVVDAVSEQLGLQVANYNGAGQIVVAGPVSAIKALLEAPPERSRAIELKVAGAFHTTFMQSAETELRAAAQGIQTGNPTLQLWSNNSGQLVESGDEFLRLLVSQVASPVRWDLCMASIDAEGVQVVELPPAGALAGLAKRGMPNTVAVALKTPADLEKIAQ